MHRFAGKTYPVVETAGIEPARRSPRRNPLFAGETCPTPPTDRLADAEPSDHPCNDPAMTQPDPSMTVYERSLHESGRKAGQADAQAELERLRNQNQTLRTWIDTEARNAPSQATIDAFLNALDDQDA